MHTYTPYVYILYVLVCLLIVKKILDFLIIINYYNMLKLIYYINILLDLLYKFII